MGHGEEELGWKREASRAARAALLALSVSLSVLAPEAGMLGSC